jgi:hypothetical protein
MRGKVLSYMPAFQPYRGKPAVRNDREGRGNIGIIRSPIRASTLPDCGGRSAMSVPTAITQQTVRVRYSIAGIGDAADVQETEYNKLPVPADR